MTGPEHLIAHQATYAIARDDAAAWMIAHGVDYTQVQEAVIHVGVPGGKVIAWLEVTWYKVDARGNRYCTDSSREMVATGHSSIPLSSWPPLTPADQVPPAGEG